jgi:TPR repeat protein
MNRVTGMTLEEAQRYQKEKDGWREEENASRTLRIQEAHATGQFGQTPKQVNEFIEAFAVLSKDTTSRVSAETAATFRKLVDAAGISEQDLVYLAILLMSHKGVKDDNYWGRKLMDISAAAGYTEASIRLVNAALVHARTRPGVLRQASTSTERGRLQKIAREGTHSRAMVLEGKVAYHLGDADTAIKWWWQAVEGAVAKSEVEASRRAAGLKPILEISNMDRDDLSSPWIELIEAHYDRSLKGKKEWHLVDKAIQIGVKQDDPTAFYYAATYYKKRDESGQHLPDSKWLYYMTKAAASGVPKAAVELATFYHESGWKYIEDEPPDHVKPTPFDSYPVTETTTKSTWDRVRQFFWPSKNDKLTEMENIFHAAAWPPTPEQRHELAVLWLNVAISLTYAPAYLQAAKIHLEETLWAGAQAPQEALDLSPKRYLYASKAEEADAIFSNDVKKYELPEDAKDKPSKAYLPDIAKKFLDHVVLARIAVVRRENTIKWHAKKMKTNDVEWEDIVLQGPEEQVDLFYKNPDVYDMWAKDSHAMYKEAQAICEKMGWKLIPDELLAKQPWMATEL